MDETKKKSKKPLIIILIVLVILAGGGLGAYFFFVPKTVNLNDYITVSFEGYDGIGTGTVTYDAEKLATDLGKISDGKIDEKLEKTIAASGANLDRASDLSNGDELKLTYYYDNDVAYDSRVTFTCTDETVTVSGLTETEKLDPFADIKLKVEGYGPYGKAKLKNKSDNPVIKALDITVTPSSGLSMGDKLTLKVKGYDRKAFIEANQAELIPTEAEITVPAMDSYLVRLDMLSDENRATLDDYTMRLGIDQYFGKPALKKYVKVTDLKKAGTYLLVKKDLSTGGAYIDKYYDVYQMTIKSNKKKKTRKGKKPYFEEQTLYQPVEILGIKLLKDGTLENSIHNVNDLSHFPIRGITDIKFDGVSALNGYKDLEKLKNDLVTAFSDMYACETEGDLP